MDSIFHRVSIRRYTSKRVEDEKVTLLLKAAMQAPSARNQQAWEFFVVRGKENLEKLSKCSPYASSVKGADVAIIPCYKKESPASLYIIDDMGAATENILLEADELGLGAVWMGIAHVAERISNVREVINLDSSLVPFAIVSIGYPAEEKKQQDRFDLKKVHYIGE